MKKSRTKVPFKLNILGFKLDTMITEMSPKQIMMLVAMSMLFILALIILLREYAVIGISISAIIEKISKFEILKIIKSRAP